jgi:glutathione S-transferase
MTTTRQAAAWNPFTSLEGNTAWPTSFCTSGTSPLIAARYVRRCGSRASPTRAWTTTACGRRRRLATSGKLPVLDWDGQRVADSSLICEFLDQRVPSPPLYPTNPRDAALARLLEDWADESLYYFEMHFRAAYPSAAAKATELLCAGRPAWERHVVGPLFRRGLNRRLKAHGFSGWSNEQIERWFFGHLDDVAAWLEGRQWLVGDTQSIADLVVSAQLEEMLRTSTIAGRVLERPSVAAWLARNAPG